MKPPNNEEKSIVLDQKPTNELSDKTEQEPAIRQKRIYNQLLRLIKENKLATARATSKALGITQETYIRYLNTPKAIKLLSANIDYYLRNMEHYGRKDWKCWKDLYNIATGNDQQTAQNQTNIQIINNDKDFIIRSA